MEVRLKADVEQKLSALAAREGRSAEALVEEAIEHLIDYDAWFLAEAEKGLNSARRGEWVDHSEVRRLIDARFKK